MPTNIVTVLALAIAALHTIKNKINALGMPALTMKRAVQYGIAVLAHFDPSNVAQTESTAQKLVLSFAYLYLQRDYIVRGRSPSAAKLELAEALEDYLRAVGELYAVYSGLPEPQPVATNAPTTDAAADVFDIDDLFGGPSPSSSPPVASPSCLDMTADSMSKQTERDPAGTNPPTIQLVPDTTDIGELFSGRSPSPLRSQAPPASPSFFDMTRYAIYEQTEPALRTATRPSAMHIELATPFGGPSVPISPPAPASPEPFTISSFDMFASRSAEPERRETSPAAAMGQTRDAVDIDELMNDLFGGPSATLSQVAPASPEVFTLDSYAMFAQQSERGPRETTPPAPMLGPEAVDIGVLLGGGGPSPASTRALRPPEAIALRSPTPPLDAPRRLMSSRVSTPAPPLQLQPPTQMWSTTPQDEDAFLIDMSPSTHSFISVPESGPATFSFQASMSPPQLLSPMPVPGPPTGSQAEQVRRPPSAAAERSYAALPQRVATPGRGVSVQAPSRANPPTRTLSPSIRHSVPASFPSNMSHQINTAPLTSRSPSIPQSQTSEAQARSQDPPVPPRQPHQPHHAHHPPAGPHSAPPPQPSGSASVSKPAEHAPPPAPQTALSASCRPNRHPPDRLPRSHPANLQPADTQVQWFKPDPGLSFRYTPVASSRTAKRKAEALAAAKKEKDKDKENMGTHAHVAPAALNAEDRTKRARHTHYSHSSTASRAHLSPAPNAPSPARATSSPGALSPPRVSTSSSSAAMNAHSVATRPTAPTVLNPLNPANPVNTGNPGHSFDLRNAHNPPHLHNTHSPHNPHSSRNPHNSPNPQARTQSYSPTSGVSTGTGENRPPPPHAETTIADPGSASAPNARQRADPYLLNVSSSSTASMLGAHGTRNGAAGHLNAQRQGHGHGQRHGHGRGHGNGHGHTQRHGHGPAPEDPCYGAQHMSRGAKPSVPFHNASTSNPAAQPTNASDAPLIGVARTASYPFPNGVHNGMPNGYYPHYDHHNAIARNAPHPQNGHYPPHDCYGQNSGNVASPPVVRHESLSPLSAPHPYWGTNVPTIANEVKHSARNAPIINGSAHAHARNGSIPSIPSGPSSNGSHSSNCSRPGSNSSGEDNSRRNSGPYPVQAYSAVRGAIPMAPNGHGHGHDHGHGHEQRNDHRHASGQAGRPRPAATSYTRIFPASGQHGAYEPPVPPHGPAGYGHSHTRTYEHAQMGRTSAARDAHRPAPAMPQKGQPHVVRRDGHHHSDNSQAHPGNRHGHAGANGHGSAGYGLRRSPAAAPAAATAAATAAAAALPRPPGHPAQGYCLHQGGYIAPPESRPHNHYTASGADPVAPQQTQAQNGQPGLTHLSVQRAPVHPNGQYGLTHQNAQLGPTHPTVPNAPNAQPAPTQPPGCYRPPQAEPHGGQLARPHHAQHAANEQWWLNPDPDAPRQSSSAAQRARS